MFIRWLALLAASLAPAVVAARSVPAAHGFVVDQWTTEDGLPLDHALDVAFTADGFVWVATVEGLLRFDGVGFAPMDDAWISALGSRRIVRVVTHPQDGSLWLMAEQHAVARHADGVLQVWDGARELGGAPSSWWIDPAGSWLWGAGSVFRLEDAPVRVPGTEDIEVRTCVPAGRGVILCLTVDGALSRISTDAAPERLGAAHGAMDVVNELLSTTREDTPGIRSDGMCRIWEGARFVPADEVVCQSGRRRTRSEPARPWAIDGATITHDGQAVWQLQYQAEQAAVDPRGHFWVTTRGEGLLRVRPAALRHLAVDDADRGIDHVRVDRADRLWARRSLGQRWSLFDPVVRWTGSSGHELAGDVHGFPIELAPDRFLFIGRGTSRVVRLDGDVLVPESEPPSTVRTACAEATLHDGSRVLGSDDGVHILDGAGPVPLPGDVAVRQVRALVPLDDGALAIGTKGQGLAVMDAARRVRQVGRPGALLVDHVRHVRRDGDTLWVSTEEEGLCAVGPLSGGLDVAAWRCHRPAGVVRGVHASEVDDAGRTWLSSNVGLWVGRTPAFEAFAAGGPPPDMLQLGTDAGMAKAEANGPFCGTVARDRAGALWFPTQDGVVGVEAARFSFPEAPRVHVEAARVGDQVMGEPLLLEPDQPVRLAWTAPAPEYADQVVFRVRLGEAHWSAPSRDRGVTLAELPPGPFRFEVQAGVAGAWGPVATIAGVRRARWHEEPVVWGLGAVLAIGFGAGVVRLRMRALRRRQRALEAEVAERTAEVQTKADALLLRTAQLAEQSARLAELEGLRTRAIVNLHHELRTPLTLVMTGLERLSRPAAQQESVAFERMLRNAGRLQELMGQLGDIARLEAGEVVPRARRLLLRTEVAAIVGRFQGLVAERGLTLAPPLAGAELWVWMDPDILDKILGNLVHNALKFTPPGGSVTVGVIEAEELVRVEVDDTGPGVPEHARDRVFDRLYQVDRGDDRPHEGSGVGLALARELTELCGGEIGNQPREGGGTQFWFTLPRGSAHLLPDEVAADGREDGAPSTEEAISGPEGAPLLLVVEDHADMRAWFVEELREGFRVVTACDGEQGLARAVELRPALVVSDIMMPRLDGLALARALRERPGAPPVLLISAKVSAADRDAALAVADGWLPKPFSSTALRAEVRRLTLVELESQDRAVPPAPTLAVDRRLLERLAATVDERLADESLSVPELARAAGTSERTLHRELARIAGVTPSRWIREHRLLRAAEMLRRGEYRTVSEVAAAVGMSRAWFTRMYRAWSGHSPGEDIQ